MRRAAFLGRVPVLAAVLVSLVAVLAATPAGTRLGAGLLRTLVSEIDFEAVEGTLLDGVVVRGFSYRDAGTAVTAARVEVRAHLLALARGRLEVKRLRADRVRVRVAGTGAGRSGLRPPFALVVGDARVRDLRVAVGGGPAAILDTVEAAFALDRDGRARAERLAIGAGAVHLSVHGTATFGPQPRLDLETTWRVAPPDGPALRGGGSVRGPLEALAIEQRLQAPVTVELRGRADARAAPSVWSATATMAADQVLPVPSGWPPTRAGGRVHVEGRGTRMEIDARLEGASRALGLWEAELQAVLGEGRVLDVRRLAVALAAGGRIAAGGEVDFGRDAELRVELGGEWADLTWPGAPVVSSPDGRFTITGTAQAYGIELSGRFAALPVGDGALRITARGDAGTLRIERLVLEAAEGAVQAHGTLDWRGDLTEVTLAGEWRDLAHALDDGRRLISPRGHFALDGTTAGYRISSDFGLRLDALPAGEVRLAATGHRNGLRLRQFEARVRDGLLRGHGAVDWEDGEPRWQLEADAQRFDPSWLAPGWPGRIDLRAQAHGHGRDLTLEVADLQGALRGLPVRGHGVLGRSDGRYRLGELALRSGRSSVHIGPAGAADARVLVWNVASPDLGELWPGAQGRVHGAGRLAGRLERPRVSGRIEAEDVALGAYAAGAVNADVDIDAAAGGDVGVEVRARDVRTPSLAVPALALDANGSVDGHTLELRADTAAGRIALAGRAAFDTGGGWRARLATGTWEPPRGERMVLDGAAEMAIAQEAMTLARQCWSGTPGRICFAGAAGARWHAEVELEDFAPARLGLPRLRGDAAVDGRLHAAGERSRLLEAQADLRSRAGRLELQAASGIWWPLAYDSAAVALETTDNVTVRAQLALVEPAPVPATLILSLPAPPLEFTALARIPFEARLQAKLTDLAALARWIPDVEDVAGRADIDLSIAGSASAPALAGRARLEVPAMTLPRLGVALEDLRIDVQPAPPGHLQVEGRVRSGPGALEVEGDVDLRAISQWQARLHLAGERFELTNLPEAWVLASPRLDLSLGPERVELTGEVLVPEARISPQPVGDAVAVSDDAIVTDGARAPAERRWEVISDVRIRLGDAVRFEAHGITGRLAGEVRAVDTPHQATRGTGEIRVVDGAFEAYGQTLALEHARIVFAGGPIDDPAVEARAVRRVGTVTAGVQAHGRLREPVLTLFSTPKLPDSEVLSYLILGQGFSDASAGDAKVLMNAAASIGLRRGELLSQKIARAFHLDELSVSGDPAREDLALTLGKYLSPKLYVGYGMGLLEPSSTVRLRYELTPSWRLEAETGTETGADVLYTIER